MAVQNHPVDSYSEKLNFWEEFPSYKVHRLFGDFWRLNKENKTLKESSSLMWALSLCYDRKSSMFNQPELDKWEAVSENVFGPDDFLKNLAEDPKSAEPKLVLPPNTSFHVLIDAFEQTIDTPLGLSLRALEAKLVERTAFITKTPYTLDDFETNKAGKAVLKKGTADQLDKMFTNTGKINELVQKAMDELKSSEGVETAKGGGRNSLSDSDDDY